jgi:hypothetical protein
VTPTERSQDALFSLAMPMTSAPVLRASCTVSEPTPPAAPLTTTVSPATGCTARTEA